MPEFLRDAPNYENEPLVHENVEKYIAEVRQYLPELPKDLKIYLDNQRVIPDTGSGGYAYAPNIFNIGFDTDFHDKEYQQKQFRGMIFHELYHLVQGHTEIEPRAKRPTMLHSAIYEGCSTVFEREYTESIPPWGDYSMVSDNTMSMWKEKLAAITEEVVYSDPATWRRWAIDGDGTAEGRWPQYRLGTKLVDDYLAKTGKDIVDLRLMQADEILKEVL